MPSRCARRGSWERRPGYSPAPAITRTRCGRASVSWTASSRRRGGSARNPFGVCSLRLSALPSVSGVVFVVLAALAIHAAGGLENVLRVEAAQGTRLQNLLDGVFGDHHPLRRVRH